LNTGSRIFSTPQSSNIGYGGNDCATIKVGSNTAVYTTNVWGQSDKISLMDSNLNQVGQSVSTLSDSGSDGSYSIYVTAIPSLYGTGLLDFFVNQDQNLGPVDGPGPKTIFMNNGDGTFTNKGTIFTTNSGCCGVVVPLRINNQPAVLINGIDGTASIFSGTNQYSTANTFKDLISGGSSTVYQNLNNGNIFIFEHKGSSIFVKPFVK